MRQILITIDEIKLKATLLNTPTADEIYNALPFDGQAQIWGNEIYFGVQVRMGEEDEAREEVEVGDLAFWPIGSAFCIFYGTTPVSTGDKPRAYSRVNVFGKIEENTEALKQVEPYSLIQVRKIE